ncbi:MAG: creatininase family protein [Actinomycetota bacterium]
MNELSRLTWKDARLLLNSARLAVIPTGSCEQHGPHMSLATDLEIAEGFSRRLVQGLGDSAFLCPSVPYGLSEHHMGFPGTLTLRPETFMGVLSDLLESLRRWDVRRALFVNGHGGNTEALRLAARKARRDAGMIVGTVMWSQVAADTIAQHTKSSRYGHACEVETSVALILAPRCVFADRIEAPQPVGPDEPLTDPPGARVDRPIWFSEWTHNGSLGDPRLTDEVLGREVVDVAYERVLTFARNLAQADIDAF